jgi:hypothetical protein
MLMDQKRKDNHVNDFNGVSPPNACVDGKVIDIIGKRLTLSRKNKFEVNFGYSESKPFLAKIVCHQEFLLEGDVTPRQI